ncbi:MAG: DUF2336 domain-containing protein [Rhodospirillales bacterium]
MTAALSISPDFAGAGFAAYRETPADMIDHLRQGQYHLFEAGLARRLNLRMVEVRRMVHERAGARLAVACRAAGFTRDEFQTAYRLIQSSLARLPAPGVCGADWPQQLAALFDMVRPADAESALRRWRRAIGAGFPVSSPLSSHAVS